MLETFTFKGEVIRLFRAQPQLDQAALKVEHTLRTISTSTRTGRVHTSPAYASIRHRMVVPYVLARERADQLMELLGQLTHARVGIPLWPAYLGREATRPAPYLADFLLNFDATGYAFRPAAELPDYHYAYTAPLVIGYLDPKPQLQMLTDQLALVSVTLVEDSPWELRIRPNATGLTYGNTWPTELRPSGVQMLTGTDDIIDLIEPTRGRERAVEGDEAPRKWWQEATLQLPNPDQVRRLLGWWANRQARLRPFETPVWFRPGPDRTTTPHRTVAAFASDTLTLEYRTTGYAEARVRLVELPWQQLDLPNPGGSQPGRVWMVEFTYQVPGPVQWRFTNHEHALQSDEDTTWLTYDSLTVKRPKQQLGVGKEVWELSCYRPESGRVEDCPLMLTIPNNLEGELECRIYSADPETPSNLRLECVGNVIPDGTQGREIRFKVGSFTSALERKVPWFRIQRQCNYQVFSRLCGLSESAHRRQVTITDVQGATITLSATGERSLVGGRLFGGNGLGFEQRPILGQRGSRIDIRKPLRHLKEGSTIFVVPGCAGTPEACQAYGNYSRFGGHPHVPVNNNPSITPISSGNVEMAKK